jgi:hypothetical protein
MTDNLERVFVEIKFDEKAAKGEQVATLVGERLKDFPYQFSVTLNKPPSVFTDKEIEDRFTDLFIVAQKFKNRFVSDFGGKITVDPRLLYLATISAYIDIERYKTYHLEKPYKHRSDAIKRAAYLTKWIARFSPIQAQLESDDLHPDHFKPNARPALASIIFSIQVSMDHISIDCMKRTFLEADPTMELAYDLLYRKVNEDTLLATYQKIVHLAKGMQLISHG